MASGRDSKTGRFAKGNPGGGRKKKPDEIKDIHQRTVPELVALAFSPETRVDLRVAILKWLTEMDLGKPGQKVDVDARTEGVQVVQFEGDLAEWAQ